MSSSLLLQEFALEIEKGKELEMRYNDTTAALVDAESSLSQKDMDIKVRQEINGLTMCACVNIFIIQTLIAKLETEHDLATKEIKDQHRTILEGLSSTHIKELEHAESQMDSCVQSTRVKTEVRLFFYSVHFDLNTPKYELELRS